MAQAQVVYDKILGRMPAILPRASFTIVEPPVARFLSQYGLDMRDLLAGPQHLRAKMEQKSLPSALAGQFDESEAALRTMLKAYEEPLEPPRFHASRGASQLRTKNPSSDRAIERKGRACRNISFGGPRPSRAHPARFALSEWRPAGAQPVLFAFSCRARAGTTRRSRPARRNSRFSRYLYLCPWASDRRTLVSRVRRFPR